MICAVGGVRIWISAIVLAPPLLAQNPYGRITGRITDSAGALVPNASVRVANVDTNVATHTASNAEGNYELANLNPGQYRVVVELTGFKRYERGPLEVRVGDVLENAIVGTEQRRIAAGAKLTW